MSMGEVFDFIFLAMICGIRSLEETAISEVVLYDDVYGLAEVE